MTDHVWVSNGDWLPMSCSVCRESRKSALRRSEREVRKWVGNCMHNKAELCPECQAFAQRMLDTPDKIAELKSRSDEADAIMAARSADPDRPSYRELWLDSQARLAAAERVVEAARNLEPVANFDWVGKWRVGRVVDALFDYRKAYSAEPASADAQVTPAVTTASWPDMAKAYDPDYMCPNCVTPWKCNGPHTAQRSADLNISEQEGE